MDFFPLNALNWKVVGSKHLSVQDVFSLNKISEETMDFSGFLLY